MSALRPVPLRIDLSALVRRSVATLYSHLVTRPTGQALRVGIESQICELGAPCLSVLDFSQVVVLDYSCADEAIAKLLARFQRDDRPAEAYFVARGVGSRHRETIEAVLARYGLALVAELDDVGFTLLGGLSPLERSAWCALDAVEAAVASEVAERLGQKQDAIDQALARLLAQRVAVQADASRRYYALTSLLRAG
ncbi:MAG: hypothetical protein HY561_02200 [Gemmatimonadetes bacterium]|nr:hypothetical protein [Gemmatimonadota bacterium]